MNCGPRNRFVIATEDGPLIVHNCENATQAASTGAWGVLGDAMLRVEADGFPIVLDVHDEIITEPPDDPAFTTERLCALLSVRPWWADANLPLAAAGFEGQRYRKD